MKKVSWFAAAALSAALAPVCMAQVTGKITLDGEAPEAAEIDMSGVAECAKLHADPVYDPSITVGEDNGLANVIVSIKTDDPSSLGGEAASEPAVLDQHGCMYEPHVLTITVGQDLVVKNSDPFLHNVHSLAQTNPSFNFGQPNVDAGKKPSEQPKVTETFRVKCDVHPWMSAYIGVFEHPFHAVTDENGSFTLPEGLPDGEYTVTLWHEKLGEKEETIEVADGKAELSASFSAADARGNAVEDVQLASSSSSSSNEECDEEMACCAAKSATQAQAKAE